ncbi:potassium channel family protein [Jeotgalibacillus haloalkalitolerans]|uniref:Potassium channel family protein n=1 Tax=Jeotgalibacillus haloalkalitolerans TaxID=3104292 RepID=A0ABU5KQY8_9BACL|nr:potassium channel family protein [Jeotgalibacillus sp. HH7-29]MDZ5713663.1 potassium channel family protein [Jeotgalibacillus sp. HH7-29]
MIIQHISRLPKWIFLISALLFLIFSGGILAFIIEPQTFKTVGDGWWWALVTISTLGYGDLVPASAEGRILAAALLVIGAGLLSSYFFMFAALILRSQQSVREGAAAVSKSDHIIVVGWNARAYYILSRLDEDAIIIDQSLSTHPMYDQKQVDFIKGTAYQSSVLQKACVEKAKEIIITADQHLNEEAADTHTVLTILTAKQMNPSIRCVAELISTQLKEQAISAGADSIVLTKRVIGEALLSQHQPN